MSFHKKEIEKIELVARPAGVGPQGLRATAATAVARIAAVLVWRATGGAGVPAPAFQ